MLMFLSRYYPDLLETDRVLMVRAPLFRVIAGERRQHFYAGSEGHLEHILTELNKAGVSDPQILRYRGLGSLEPELLMTRCIDRATRSADVMTPRDAEMAIEVFGGINLQ
jgi:DNA gyrase/topoisomerase IV subunit B